MSHEPECYCNDDEHSTWCPLCICTPLRSAYRRGYNDRARCGEIGEAVWGFGCN